MCYQLPQTGGMCIPPGIFPQRSFDTNMRRSVKKDIAKLLSHSIHIVSTNLTELLDTSMYLLLRTGGGRYLGSSIL